MEKKRDSSIELLRIVLMTLIVFGHFLAHGGAGWAHGEPVFLRGIVGNGMVLRRLIYPLYIYHVDCFIFISGFFGIRLNASKVIYFVTQLIFYSLLTTLLFASFSGDWSFIHSYKEVLHCIFPISSNTWYFFSNYFLLMLLSPFLNKGVDSIDKRKFQLVLLLVFLISISGLAWMATSMNYFGLFLLIYLLGRYFNKYPLSLLEKHSIWVFAAGVVGTYITGQFLDMSYINPFVIVSAVAFFYMFKSLKIGYKSSINGVAKMVFVVYLVTDSPALRDIIDVNIIRTFRDCYWVLPLVALAIVLVLSTVGRFFQFAILNPVNGALNKIYTRLRR